MFGNYFAATQRFLPCFGFFLFFISARRLQPARPDQRSVPAIPSCAVVLTSDSAAAGVQSHPAGALTPTSTFARQLDCSDFDSEPTGLIHLPLVGCHST